MENFVHSEKLLLWLRCNTVSFCFACLVLAPMNKYYSSKKYLLVFNMLIILKE